MAIHVLAFSPGFRDELTAATEAGLYETEEAFLDDAVHTFLAARPDLREAIACKLYERGATYRWAEPRSGPAFRLKP